MIDVSQELFGKLPQSPLHEKKKKTYLLEWKERIFIVKEVMYDCIHYIEVKLYQRLFQFGQGNKIYQY